MPSATTQILAIDTFVPAVLTSILMILIWATLRLMLVLSGESTMLGVQIPSAKRLNPVVLAAKSDFKQSNTKVLLLFLAAIILAMSYSLHSAVLLGALILPPAQVLAGLAFWVRGRRAIRAEMSRSDWRQTGTERNAQDAPGSASKSAGDQYAHYQRSPGAAPQNFDLLVYPKSAGWMFIIAYGVLVATSYVVWWHQDVGTAAELRQLYRAPVIGASGALVAFLISYSLSFYNPAAPGQPRGKDVSERMAGLQRGIAAVVLAAILVLSASALIPQVPLLAEQEHWVRIAQYCGLAAAVMAFISTVAWPIWKEQSTRRAGGMGRE